MKNQSKPIKTRYQFEEVSPEETRRRIDNVFDFIFNKVIEKMIEENRGKYENH